MSGFFKDSVFEGLDDISQLVEPFQCRFNEELHKLPDRIEVDYSMLMKMISPSRYGDGFNSISIREILAHNTRDISINWEVVNPHLKSFFKLIVDDGDAEEKRWECHIDLERKRLSHPLTLIKDSAGYTDEELYDRMTDNLRQQCRQQLRRASQLYKANINEIAEVFDIEGVHKFRGLADKRNTLVTGLIEQFEERRINIRNFELGLRFADWIVHYIVNGNAAAIKNLTLFKVMMLNGKPIYSIDNEEAL